VTAGGQVTATLTGFGASAATKIRLYDINGSTTVLSVWVLTTDANGGARQTFTTKTSLTVGKHKVIATDALKNSASTYLTTTAFRPEPPEPDDPAISQLYYRGTSGRREVALTFDLDADRGYAEYVLDVLAAHGVKATFGVAGYWASANPDLIRRMVSEGHQIINHSMTHPSFTGAVAGEVAVLSRDARLGELWAQEAVISRITGGYVQEPYWRPPYGDFNTSVLIDVAAGGYTATIMWTCDTMGWYGASAAQIINTCGYGAVAGDIILMHPSSRSMDGPALPDLIAVLRSRGFAFATVERILQ
jgi:peptidoglycan/xylan/chitin deacetylase (PgdA/CDA1 family)